MTRPPLRTSPSPYIRRAIQSRHTPLKLSKLPKLPKGTPPLLSRRSTPGDLEFDVIWNRDQKTVDDDFAQAARLEASAEKKLGPKSGKLSQKAMQFPVVKLQSLDIRMIPKKMLVVKKQVESPILSKNPRKEQSKFSLLVIATKAAVHNFAVVRVRVKRRVIGALDLIVRRGAYSFPAVMSKQPSKVGKPDVKGRKPDSEEPGILLHDQTLANPQAWILPDWTYIVFPKAEVFRMPLPDLVNQIGFGLQQANQRARAWQGRYVSSETGEFIPLLSKGFPKPRPLPEPKPWKPKKFGSRTGKENEFRKIQTPSRRPPDTWQGSDSR